MTHSKASCLARSRGYTAVELVMAIGIFAVGVTGVFAMQRVTSGSNAHAKNLATATFAAESWLEQLAVDATLWTQPPNLKTKTTWIKEIGSNPSLDWSLPAATPTSSPTFGPGFDPLGNYAPNASAAFCTNIRLTKLMDEPNGLLRADVRVFWPKPGPQWSGGVNCPTLTDEALPFFHFVHKSTLLKQVGGRE